MFCFFSADGNRLQLQLIDGAAFCLAFDDEDVADPLELSRSFLFSNGVNRYYKPHRDILLLFFSFMVLAGQISQIPVSNN